MAARCPPGRAAAWPACRGRTPAAARRGARLREHGAVAAAVLQHVECQVLAHPRVAAEHPHVLQRGGRVLAGPQHHILLEQRREQQPAVALERHAVDCRLGAGGGTREQPLVLQRQRE
eukprot:scaffold124604_cov33-Phaeocystis_antarctica.AAC.2